MGRFFSVFVLFKKIIILHTNCLRHHPVCQMIFYELSLMDAVTKINPTVSLGLWPRHREKKRTFDDVDRLMLESATMSLFPPRIRYYLDELKERKNERGIGNMTWNASIEIPWWREKKQKQIGNCLEITIIFFTHLREYIRSSSTEVYANIETVLLSLDWNIYIL
jgi:hypothetical protein